MDYLAVRTHPTRQWMTLAGEYDTRIVTTCFSTELPKPFYKKKMQKKLNKM